MSTAQREAELEEIDAYLADAKSLSMPVPTWTAQDHKFLKGTWPVLDSAGIVSSALRFTCHQTKDRSPSIYLIYKQRHIFGIDLDYHRKVQPLTAHALGLPSVIDGPHWHTWGDNRTHLLLSPDWTLPHRRPATNITKLAQALPALCAATNIGIDPEQRQFDVPPQGALF